MYSMCVKYVEVSVTVAVVADTGVVICKHVDRRSARVETILFLCTI